MRYRALAGLLVATALAHAAHAAFAPAPQLAGDELHYVRTAQRDVAEGARWPLPGTLRFGHRPEAMSRVLAALMPDSGDEATLRARAALLNGALLLALVAAVFYQARILEMSDGGALLAAGTVAAFPWLGFHVHSLWPELLHAALLAAALLGVLLHLRDGARRPLVAGGVALGAALLVKGTLAPFVPVLLAAIAWSAWRRETGLDAPARAGRAAATAGLCLLATLAVMGPQLAANAAAGHGWRLAANRWWNLELGLTVPTDASLPGVASPDGRWRSERAQQARYAAAAPRAAAREAAARDRVRAFVAAAPPAQTALRQGGKLLDLLWVPSALLSERRAAFEQALDLHGRWGSPPPAWLAGLRAPALGLWRGTLLLGLAGLLIAARAGAGHALLAGFAVAFFAAALAAPVKVRFLLPVFPVLALGLGLLFDRGRSRWARAEAAA